MDTASFVCGVNLDVMLRSFKCNYADKNRPDRLQTVFIKLQEEKRRNVICTLGTNVLNYVYYD